MATDPFLTKKSVLGLAERVVLSPPPTLIQFTLSSNNVIIYNQDFDDWYLYAPEGGIALGVGDGGGYLQVMEKFYCILQKAESPFVYAFGATMSDDYSGMVGIKFRINTSTMKFDQ